MATATRGTPSATASVAGRNGKGRARCITAPETSEVKKTSGGRRRPRFATPRAAVEPPPCGGLVVMWPRKPVDRLRHCRVSALNRSKKTPTLRCPLPLQDARLHSGASVGAYNGGPGNPNQRYEEGVRMADYARRV